MNHRFSHVSARSLRRGLIAAGAALAAFAGVSPASTRPDAPTVIKVGSLHVGDGKVIEKAIVVIESGKITAVGPSIPIPGGATVIDLPKGSLTPGLIDANAAIEPADVVSRRQAQPSAQPSALALMFHNHTNGDDCFICSGQPMCALAAMHENLEAGQICPCCGYPTLKDVDSLISGVERSVSLTESSSEVVPHTRVIDSMNLRTPDFDRLAFGGVTTVFISPDASAVIGPQGAIARTGGPMTERLVKPAADVKAAMGTDSFSVGADNSPPFRGFVGVRTRRPNTRMGVTWVFRKAFYDTRKWKDGLEISGADAPPAEAFPMLQSILDGKTPLRVQARMHQDILTAIRLTDEFNLKFTLVEGVESYKCLSELKAKNIPVIYGPVFMDASGLRRFAGDIREPRLSTLTELLNAGIETALSAQDLREEDGLARQAMYAVRGGADPEQVLKAVTVTPAKLLGIDKDTGSVETGKRADLVVWSGQPFEATSRPLVVLIGGRVVMDARDKKSDN